MICVGFANWDHISSQNRHLFKKWDLFAKDTHFFNFGAGTCSDGVLSGRNRIRGEKE